MSTIDPSQMYRGDFVLHLLQETGQNNADVARAIMEQRDRANNDVADARAALSRMERQLGATQARMAALEKQIEALTTERDNLLAEKAETTGAETTAGDLPPVAPPVH